MRCVDYQLAMNLFGYLSSKRVLFGLIISLTLLFLSPSLLRHLSSQSTPYTSLPTPSTLPPHHVVLWSNDYHISPIHDLKNFLGPLNVTFIDKSLSGHCHVTGTCQGRANLKVINVNNAMNLADRSLIARFYEAYKEDEEMNRVDAFVCFHPTSMCELFEPFKKPLIIIASTRYELGRFGAKRWMDWNSNLIRYAADSRNIIGGNNLYDVEYIKYFTGIQPQLMTSMCDYVPAKYKPQRPGYLLAPIHHGGFAKEFNKLYASACGAVNCTVKLSQLRSMYPHYAYTDLAAHQGIVYVPYQVSVMSFFEQYRMNIPLFFPSLSLLANWQHKDMVMNERTWDGVWGKRPKSSTISRHPSISPTVPDPNNEQDLEAIKYWIQFSDFYQFPHVTYYNSTTHLVNILDTTTTTQLLDISSRMTTFNAEQKQQLTEKWTEILDRIRARNLQTK